MEILSIVSIALLVITILLILFKKPATPDDSILRAEINRAGSDVKTDLTAQRGELREILDSSQQSQQTSLRTIREELDKKLEGLRVTNDDKLEMIRRTLDEKFETTIKSSLTENSEKIAKLTESNLKEQEQLRSKLSEEIEKLRERLGTELETLRSGNEKKLEEMRATVDEKLQGTLEKRLGESFKLVSERLELVQKGLGEMQTLATDVGGLKRVLTNVKSRGSWGEVQLSRQLEDILTHDQYVMNAKIIDTSSEVVEYAVKLPGRTEGETVLLPIDSKFPQEDYERLLEAQEAGDLASIEISAKAIEREIRNQAKIISEKYIHPPHSTDFALMYLPTEGLFAEVIRRPGLASKLQSEYRVMVTGPTTLMSLLNSLQMGFKTLAIEKSTSEVWKVLSTAKAEFNKYGEVLDRLKKQLQTAQNTVDAAGTRTRAIERTLRTVESLEINPTTGDDLLETSAALATAIEPDEDGDVS